MNKQLTLWNILIYETLIVAGLVKDFPLSVAPEDNYHVHKGSPLAIVLF
jgi:hypothetical protein